MPTEPPKKLSPPMVIALSLVALAFISYVAVVAYRNHHTTNKVIDTLAPICEQATHCTIESRLDDLEQLDPNSNLRTHVVIAELTGAQAAHIGKQLAGILRSKPIAVKRQLRIELPYSHTILIQTPDNTLELLLNVTPNGMVIGYNLTDSDVYGVIEAGKKMWKIVEEHIIAYPEQAKTDSDQ